MHLRRIRRQRHSVVLLATLALGTLIAAFAASFTTAAGVVSAGKTRHFDSRDNVAPSETPTADQKTALRDLGARMLFNPRLGVPVSVINDGGALTSPSTREPDQVARDFLRDNARLFRLQ